MHLVEIFLPKYDNQGKAFSSAIYDQVRMELTERFGGVTAFLRSPAHGWWQDDAGATRSDEITILEVMAEELDRDWWRAYRSQLEKRFDQDEVVVRAHAIETL